MNVARNAAHVAIRMNESNMTFAKECLRDCCRLNICRISTKVVWVKKKFPWSGGDSFICIIEDTDINEESLVLPERVSPRVLDDENKV